MCMWRESVQLIDYISYWMVGNMEGRIGQLTYSNLSLVNRVKIFKKPKIENQEVQIRSSFKSGSITAPTNTILNSTYVNSLSLKF